MWNGGHLRPGQQVTGLPQGLNGGDFLSLPMPGVHFADGDAVPTISATYGTRPSGLLVPIDYVRTPTPLDSVATYLTGREILGMTIPAELTVDHLRRQALLDVVGFCAGLLGLVDQPRCSQAQVDATLQPAFHPAVRRRIAALLANGDRMLVAPQILLELIKNAARCSGDCLLPGTEPGNVIVTMLGTGDDLQPLSGQDTDDDLVVGTGTPGRLEREIVAIHHFHRQTEARHVLAKFIRRWKQLPVELAGDPEVVDLAAEFGDAVGVSLDDFIAAGVLIHATTTVRGHRLPRDLLSHLNIDVPAAERILSLVARTPADLRAWARDSSSAPAWEFSHLERFPILDCGDHLVVLRPGLVLQRFFGWLPLFDVEAGLGAGKAAKKRKGQIRSCMGHLSEIYAAETLRSQARRHGMRVFTEEQLRAALSPAPGRRTSDLTVDDGRRWAVFEMTSSQLTRESIASTSAARLDDDFAKLVGKIHQLDQTISSLREHETALTGLAVPPAARRYYPVLVMTEGFPINPVTLTMLRQRVTETGLLQGDDISELEVVDGTELEILEGSDLGEITLLDALEAKTGAALHRANLRDFLLREHQLRATTPDRIKQLAEVAFEIAVRALRQPPAAA